MREVYFLVAKGYLVHPLPGASKDDIRHSTELRFGKPGVGVFDATLTQGFHHAIRYGFGLIHRNNLTSFNDFKVKPFTGAVIVAVLRCPFPTSFRPVALMLVALTGGHALSGPDVHNLFDVVRHVSYMLFLQLAAAFAVSAFCPSGAKCVLGYVLEALPSQRASPA